MVKSGILVSITSAEFVCFASTCSANLEILNKSADSMWLCCLHCGTETAVCKRVPLQLPLQVLIMMMMMKKEAYCPSSSFRNHMLQAHASSRLRWFYLQPSQVPIQYSTCRNNTFYTYEHCLPFTYERQNKPIVTIWESRFDTHGQKGDKVSIPDNNER